MSDPLDAVTPALFIDGQWRAATSGATFDVHNPATGQPLMAVADATPDDAAAAFDAAVAAAPAWADTPPRERSDLLRRAFDLIHERGDLFARLMTLEMGKPLVESRAEVDYGAEFFRWFAEEAVRIQGRYTIAPDARSRILVSKRPVGPSLLITPWNFPLAMATRKIGPALAAGCTCVLKPAHLTPLTALALAAVLADAGLPAGVVNVVTTSRSSDVSDPILTDPRLRKLSFTGSTDVGRLLLGKAAPNIVRCSMELGGNAPFIVFDDADLDAAVAGARIAKLRNMGEACTAANRFLVHRAVVEEFTQRLTSVFEDLQVGDGLGSADIGPLIDEHARAGAHAKVLAAVAQGARVRTGGVLPEGPGWFYPPTVLDRVPADCDLMRSEIFGPVAPIAVFEQEEEAIALANATEFGLAGYVYTRSMDRILRLSERIAVGMLGVNQGIVSNPAAPFGGVRHSGLGREGGSEGIDEYCETLYIGVADPWA